MSLFETTPSKGWYSVLETVFQFNRKEEQITIGIVMLVTRRGLA